MTRTLQLLTIAGLGLGLCMQAEAQECALSIEGNDAMMFNKSEMKVSSSCKEVTVTLAHTGKLAANIMGHNWVLAKTSEYESVAAAGQSAPDYVPKDDPRVLAATKVIGGGEQTSVTFDISGLASGGAYTYFCSFPAHWVLMKGKFVIE